MNTRRLTMAGIAVLGLAVTGCSSNDAGAASSDAAGSSASQSSQWCDRVSQAYKAYHSETQTALKSPGPESQETIASSLEQLQSEMGSDVPSNVSSALAKDIALFKSTAEGGTNAASDFVTSTENTLVIADYIKGECGSQAID